jgi:hypothetical protein
MSTNPFELFTPQQKAMFYIMYKNYAEKLQTTGRETATMDPLPDHMQFMLDLANFQLSIIHEMEQLFTQAVDIDELHLLDHFNAYEADQAQLRSKLAVVGAHC